MTQSNDQRFDSLDGRDLRLLFEIDKQGSINRAAQACGIGQPAATKRLQRMAKSLEFDLVRTDGPSAVLTAEGKALAAHGRRVLRSAKRLEADLAAKRSA